MGWNVSLKIHFLESHLDISQKISAKSVKNTVKDFTGTSCLRKSGTKASWPQVCWQTIAGQWRGMYLTPNTGESHTSLYFRGKFLPSWFQTFAVFWILCVFFRVFPRRPIVVCRRFGTLYQFHLQGLDVEYSTSSPWNTQIPNIPIPNTQIPKRIHTSFCLFQEHVNYYFEHLNSSVSLKPCLIETFCVHIWIQHKKCCWVRLLKFVGQEEMVNFVDQCNSFYSERSGLSSNPVSSFHIPYHEVNNSDHYLSIKR